MSDSINISSSLREQLGLVDGMETYFLRAPQEYWQALGKKPQPYNDNVSEYDFIHAFFKEINEMSNYADILVSKLAEHGILWVSWPKLSNTPDSLYDNQKEEISIIFSTHKLKQSGECLITDTWYGLRFDF